MIIQSKEFDENIEINIFRCENLLTQMQYDGRIQIDIARYSAVDANGKANGHAFFPEELKDGHKHKKICYCEHSQISFHETTITVFHLPFE